jgi:hypothetical protein
MSVVNLRGGNSIATADNIRIGKRLMLVWVKEGGIIFPTPNFLQYMHKVSDVPAMDEWAAEFINERDIFESGSTSLQTNDGTDWSTVITFEGDSIPEMASLVGQDLHVHRILPGGKDYGRQGHLAMLSFDSDYNFKIADVLYDVGVKFLSAPGTSDGEITRTVELYVKQGIGLLSFYNIAGVSSGSAPAFEIFYDNGTTVTNAAAPDGVLVDFDLGDGNNSYAVPASPSIAIVAPGAGTDLYKYLVYCRVDGIDVNDSEATFDPVLKRITFATAPADGAKLEVAYAVDTAGAGPLGIPPHLNTPEKFTFNWKKYQTA